MRTLPYRCGRFVDARTNAQARLTAAPVQLARSRLLPAARRAAICLQNATLAQSYTSTLKLYENTSLELEYNKTSSHAFVSDRCWLPHSRLSLSSATWHKKTVTRGYVRAGLNDAFFFFVVLDANMAMSHRKQIF
jgi:hypothetical protein